MANSTILSIRDLYAAIDEKIVLNGINLTVNAGEVHAIMGPNGAGKSSLAQVLSGNENYQLSQGQIDFLGQDLCALSIEERARAGLLVSMQSPIEIPGVKNIYFLRAALNAKRAAQGLAEIAPTDFMPLIQQKLQQMQMDNSFLHRAVNEGFSGGERKRNEVLQMLLLEPYLAVFDEIDSGVDIDALKIVGHNINQLRALNRSLILVTHYPRLLAEVRPDFVHILLAGRIVYTGDYQLAQRLEAEGYDWFLREQMA